MFFRRSRRRLYQQGYNDGLEAAGNFMVLAITEIILKGEALDVDRLIKARNAVWAEFERRH